MTWFGVRRTALARRVATLTREQVRRVGVGAFFLALFAAHTTLLGPLLQNGDSAVYNQQIDTFDLGVRTTHLGYIALGVVFNALLPFGTDFNMNAMVLCVGFMGLIAIYVATRTLARSRVAALAAAALPLGLPSQLKGMLLSEVDVVSVAFVAMAFACFVRRKTLIAGLLFGYAVLVTPLSGPLLALFVCLVTVQGASLREVLVAHVRRIFRFGVGALLVYGPPIAIVHRSYLHGPRGLFRGSPPAFSIPKQLAQSADFIIHELGYLLPLYVVGAALCLANRRAWRLGQPALALLASMAVMGAVGQRYGDVPVQLPNLVLLGVLPAIAYGASGRLVRVGLALLFALGTVSVQRSYASVAKELRTRESGRRLCVAIAQQSGANPPVLVGLPGFTPMRMCERFASSPRRPAHAVEWRKFLNNQQAWLDPAARTQIWFFRAVHESRVAPLLEGYTLESRRIGSRRFRVLVPRP